MLKNKARAPATGVQAFFLGGYYARAERDAAGAWCVCRESKPGGGLLRGNVLRRQQSRV